MRFAIAISILCFLFVGGDVCAEHLMNGEDWVQLSRMDHPGKVYYVAGMLEGLRQGGYDFYYSEIHLPLKYERIIELLDSFYEDYKNIKVPVFHALRVIKMQVGGEREDDIETFLLELRKLSMTLE